MLQCNKGIYFRLVDMLNLHMPSLTSVSMIFFLLVVQCFNLGFGTHVTSCICCAVQCFELSHVVCPNMSLEITSLVCRKTLTFLLVPEYFITTHNVPYICQFQFDVLSSGSVLQFLYRLIRRNQIVSYKLSASFFVGFGWDSLFLV